MRNEDFTEKVERLRDEDLIRIAVSNAEEGFLPKLVSAAKSELARRDIPQTDLKIVRDQAEKENENLGNEKEEPLSDIAWLGFFLFGGIAIVSIPFVLILLFTGYHKKAKQAVGGIFGGFVFLGNLDSGTGGYIRMIEHSVIVRQFLTFPLRP